MEIDEFDQAKKSFNWNSSAVSGWTLMILGVVIFLVGLWFDIIFYFPAFIFIAGLVVLIQAAISKKKYGVDRPSDIIDDPNQI